MLSNEAIEQIFKEIEGVHDVSVEGDGYAYQLTVVSDCFQGLSKVARQQWVYKHLKPHIISGTLHAVTLYTWTKEEWESQNG